ncbi:hypothetical protein ACJRO7_004501 [Eucalyptus globulus]|uniref:Uncharacterized protein n=1 Tax=Eucalyptus globulus TaxID=34317 RepID=A0ABD3J2M4_EUCGL
MGTKEQQTEAKAVLFSTVRAEEILSIGKSHGLFRLGVSMQDLGSRPMGRRQRDRGELVPDRIDADENSWRSVQREPRGRENTGTRKAKER